MIWFMLALLLCQVLHGADTATKTEKSDTRIRLGMQCKMAEMVARGDGSATEETWAHLYRLLVLCDGSDEETRKGLEEEAARGSVQGRMVLAMWQMEERAAA